MKDEGGVCSKLELIEAISKSLKETTVSSFSPLQLPCGSSKRLGGGGGIEHQQEELEVVSVLQSIDEPGDPAEGSKKKKTAEKHKTTAVLAAEPDEDT